MLKKLMILLLIAGVAAIAFWAYKREVTDHLEKTRYENVAFSRDHITVTIESTGIVEPRNRLEIKPPIGGRIDSVLTQEGQSVKKGDIIAWMSSTERATLLDAARAGGESMLRKWDDVYKATPLIAPLDGTIIARNTEPGQTVTAQDAILVLSDRLVVTAQVDETDIGRVHVGQAAQVRLDAYPAVKVRGEVKQIAYEARTVNSVTVYEVEVDLEHIPDVMKSGMTATVLFTVAEADNALTLPSAALSVKDGKTTVLLDDGDPATPPEHRPVQTGLAASGRTEILAGLDGTETVLAPVFKLPLHKAPGVSPFMPTRKP